MKRILMAAASRNAGVAKDMFNGASGRYDLTILTDYEDALAVLDPAIDLIVTDTEFNDSRPHKLLCAVRSSPQCASIPFLYLKCIGSPFNLRDDSFTYAPGAIHGGDGYFDYTRWSSQLGHDYARAKLHIWIDHIVFLDPTNDQFSAVLA